jgi:hypothetical protein
VFAAGCSVRCERAEPARGTWSRYASREGIVVTVNRQRFANGAPDYVELGVSFTSDAGHVDAWFLPDELFGISGAQPPGGRQARATVEAPQRRRVDDERPVVDVPVSLFGVEP